MTERYHLIVDGKCYYHSNSIKYLKKFFETEQEYLKAFEVLIVAGAKNPRTIASYDENHDEWYKQNMRYMDGHKFEIDWEM